jgi:hypothetical protein
MGFDATIDKGDEMTMPLQFDKPAYLKVLREAGVPADLAEAHAEAIESGLTQPIVLPADLAVLKAEMLARMDELKAEMLARMDELKAGMFARMDELKAEMFARMDRMKSEILVRMDEKLRHVAPKWLAAISLATSAVCVVLNCMILMRL